MRRADAPKLAWPIWARFASGACAFVAIVVFVAWQAHDGLPRPYLSPGEIDVSSTYQASEQEFQFSVFNPTDTPIEVQKIEMSCGCQDVDGPLGPIAPNEMQSYTGTITVTGLSPKISSIVITVDGSPLELLIHSSPSEGWYWQDLGLDFGRSVPGEVRHASVELTYVGVVSEEIELHGPKVSAKELSGVWEIHCSPLRESGASLGGATSWLVNLEWQVPSDMETGENGALVVESSLGVSGPRLPVRASKAPLIEALERVHYIETSSDQPVTINFRNRIQSEVQTVRLTLEGDEAGVGVDTSSSTGLLECLVPSSLFAGKVGVVHAEFEFHFKSAIYPASVVFLVR